MGRFDQISDVLTEIPELDQIIPRCTVIDIPAGSTPKNIIVQLPGPDGERVHAWWSGAPPVAVDDTVKLHRRGDDGLYDVLAVDADTGQAPIDQAIVDAKGDLIVATAADTVARLAVGTDGHVLTADSGEAAGVKWAEAGGGSDTITVKNTSGGTVVPGDVGYIDAAGEYKETTTFGLAAVAWCVVVTGGANNADIEVARHGLRDVRFAGTTPTVGSYVYTSTTAGLAEDYSAMWPGMFGIVKDNSGWSVAGDTCKVLLYCYTDYVPLVSSVFVVSCDNTDTSNFVAKINAGGTGGLTSTNVPFDTVSAGAANTLVPLGADLGKIRLYNSTRGTYRLITATDIANSRFTTVASTDTWADNDDITAQSQYAVVVSAPFFYDVDLSQSTLIPATTRVLKVGAERADSGAANHFTGVATFEAPFANEARIHNVTAGGGFIFRGMDIPLFEQRFCWRFRASGSGTSSQRLRLEGAFVAIP